jgi:hypothetical protein
MSEDEYALRRPHMEAALNGDRQVFDISRRKGGGRRRSWQVVYQPRIEDGEVVGFFGVYQDNTARREAEEGLKRAYDMLETRVEERTAALKAESEARLAAGQGSGAARQAEKPPPSRKRGSSLRPVMICCSPCPPRGLLPARWRKTWAKDGSDGRQSPSDRTRLITPTGCCARLLDISRLDAGGVDAAPSVFALGELIEETAAQFGARRKRRA